jgi:hypothetical protein
MVLAWRRHDCWGIDLRTLEFTLAALSTDLQQPITGNTVRTINGSGIGRIDDPSFDEFSHLMRQERHDVLSFPPSLLLGSESRRLLCLFVEMVSRVLLVSMLYKYNYINAFIQNNQ